VELHVYQRHQAEKHVEASQQAWTTRAAMQVAWVKAPARLPGFPGWAETVASTPPSQSAALPQRPVLQKQRAQPQWEDRCSIAAIPAEGQLTVPAAAPPSGLAQPAQAPRPPEQQLEKNLAQQLAGAPWQVPERPGS